MRRTCPLSNANIDIVSEQDHYNHQCICYMCNCKKHPCPARKITLFPASTFQSSYQASYKRSKKLLVQAALPECTQHNPVANKMDLRTSHMMDYPAPKVVKTPVKSRPNTPSNNMKFVGSSQYRDSFLDWGPMRVSYNRRPVCPTHSSNLKFNANTTYTANFVKCEKGDSLVRKGSTINLNRQEDGYFETTTQRDFKGQRSMSNIRFQSKPEDYQPTKYSASHFTTESKNSFERVNPRLYDPRFLRKNGLIIR